MRQKFKRKPLKNFLIKKSLQLQIIGKTFFIVFLSSTLTITILYFIYNAKSSQGNFYYMSNDIMQDLELANIIGIILPAVIIAQLISVLIGVGIGLFSSRKTAVPIYKMERWAQQIRKGNLNIKLGFRRGDNLKELTTQCNAAVETYRGIFSRIDQSVVSIYEQTNTLSPVAHKELQHIQYILSHLNFK